MTLPIDMIFGVAMRAAQIAARSPRGAAMSPAAAQSGLIRAQITLDHLREGSRSAAWLRDELAHATQTIRLGERIARMGETQDVDTDKLRQALLNAKQTIKAMEAGR